MQKQPVLPDVLETGMVTVFCGDAAGRESAEKQEYYADSRNKFWGILFEVGLTSKKFDPYEYHDLAALRIGLTDLNKSGLSGDRKGLCDQCIFDDLCQKIKKCRPEILAFTGKEPAQIFLKAKFSVRSARAVKYGLQPECHWLGRTKLFVLPSTSGRNVRWHPDRCGPCYEQLWFELAERHQEVLAKK